MVGYGKNGECYRIYDLEKRKILRSRDVIFDENDFSHIRSLVNKKHKVRSIFPKGTWTITQEESNVERKEKQKQHEKECESEEEKEEKIMKKKKRNMMKKRTTNKTKRQDQKKIRQEESQTEVTKEKEQRKDT